MRLCALALCTFVATAMSAQAPNTYHITARSLLGGNGGWDYVIPDPSSHRLFIARGNHLMVVDENTGKLVGEVQGTHGAHGTAIAEGTGHGFATSSEDKSIVMFDLATLNVLSRIPAAEDADGIIYDKLSGRVFSMNGDANSSTVVDAKSGKLVSNIALGGKPEYAVSTGDGKIYANLEDKDEIVELDTRSASVTRRWPTAPCKQPVAMAADTTHHRLFSGCRSGVMAIVDYRSGKVITTVPIGKGVDSAAYDPATGDAFAANADGTLTVIHQDSPDVYRVVQTLPTPVGSRNMGLDPTNHRVFVVSAQFGPVPDGGKRPPVLPNSFTLLTITR
ncbi:YncE family protein [Terriglobus sp.]|uniref:YncE family protein n=1 Tax=Terriglobus sp. TaxID=1889013 RepID=UPI003B0076AD